MVRHVCLLLVLVVPAVRADLRAGAARAEITPPPGYPMWGYAARRDAPCKGVLDPLQARALVLATASRRMALVSLDLGRAPTRDMTARLRERLRKDADIDVLFLCASHTHHGPELESDLWPDPKKPYTRQLEEKLAALVVSAVKDLRPARLGISSQAATLNRNRHSKRPGAPVDSELLVLRLEDDQNKVIAHAVNFAAHPTMLPVGRHEFSADYPGVLCARVEKVAGGICLFLQGAAGDQSPNTHGRKEGHVEFGTRLADVVLQQAKGIHCQPLAKPTLRTTRDTFSFPTRIDLRNPLLRTAMSAAFYPTLVAYYEREYREGVRPELTTTVLDGRIGFVGVSGEFFCGHALGLRRRARLEHLFFLGYCNDYHQYFPTLEAASEGGYGTESYIATATLGAGEQIMDRALLRLFQLRDKLAGEKGAGEK